MAGLAKDLCLLGATDEDLAKHFEVSITTINNWKKKHISFRLAIKAGKFVADAKVAKSLYQRAIGFSQQEIDIRVIAGQVVQTTYIKKYVGDVTAQIFYLKNRRPDLWSDRRERDMSVDDQIKLVQLERLKYELAKLIASDTDTETEDDQHEFLSEIAKRLPD